MQLTSTFENNISGSTPFFIKQLVRTLSSRSWSLGICSTCAVYPKRPAQAQRFGRQRIPIRQQRHLIQHSCGALEPSSSGIGFLLNEKVTFFFFFSVSGWFFFSQKMGCFEWKKKCVKNPFKIDFFFNSVPQIWAWKTQPERFHWIHCKSLTEPKVFLLGSNWPKVFARLAKNGGFISLETWMCFACDDCLFRRGSNSKWQHAFLLCKMLNLKNWKKKWKKKWRDATTNVTGRSMQHGMIDAFNQIFSYQQ